MDLQIETTNICQAKCTFCLRSFDPPFDPDIMVDSTFKKIVVSSTEMNISVVCLTGLGDPFTDPKLEDRISFVREYHPEAKICLYTNGILAKGERVVQCVAKGLDQILFSINAATQKMHSQIMGIEDKFDIVKKNLDFALKIPKLDVVISTVLGLQYQEAGEYNDLVNLYGPEFVYGHTAGNWAGKCFKLHYKPQRNRCRWYRESIYFNLKGYMCLCCFDPYNKFGFGNINDRGASVKSLCFGDRKKEFLRRLDEKGRGNVIPCNQCSTI